MTCKADYLLEILRDEYNNGSFHYKNILMTQNEDGLCFITPFDNFGQTSWYTVPVYEPLRLIASLINGTERRSDKILLASYPITLEVYPYIKKLWERYSSERSYYD